ncbi:DUF2513 domain-containing protein [Picosynechococcus sp. PCC 73109]|uniref:DUF2513 domain-containing protein n=1 Tax=Picosynechococcus sp. PCC 73109 TaxID=374982 RepID=UPI00074589E4|nr:DUF2513 domain-containing protein [Picosynechococcus sp. PCC 73109]AMA10691.1 hypothetical protein AWQ23_14685 [Picosynechococcus sp. PCC 73109]
MKRDMELIKKILLALEANNTINQYLHYSNLNLEGYDDNEVAYHVKLAHEAGLIELAGNKPVQTIGSPPIYFIQCLTWEGHEFLDASRSPKVWNSALKIIKDKGLGISFDVLKALLSAYALHEVGLK